MKNFKIVPALLAALLPLVPPAALAGEGGLILSADAAATAFAVSYEKVEKEEWSYPLFARLRLNGGVETAKDLSFHLSYELNALRADGYDPIASTSRRSRLRIDDLKEKISDGETVVTQNLDRLFVEGKSGAVKATVGRQAVGHGSGRIFNPSDIFAPLAVQTNYTEYKRGIDALRATVERGEDLSLEVILAAHEEGFDRSFYLLRTQAVLGGGNYSLYAGNTLGAGTVGFDAATDLAGAGLYGEGIYRTDEPLYESLRAMCGVHRKLSTDFGMMAELLYNGVGESNPQKYPLAQKTREWKNAEVSLLGRWYGAFSADWEATPLWTLSLTVIANTHDGSLLLNPKASWSAAEGEWGTLYINLGASAGTPGRDRKGEFGGYPDLYFAEAVLNI
jgi:hypothetical protein